MSGLASPVKKQRTPQLFLDSQDKTDEARTTFHEISECIYANKQLGHSGQNEQMTCDCHENWDQATQRNLACGEHSECINRATSVECVNRSCGCGDDCQNQRFQKKQYADVSVIQTELKGYGLRANVEINEAGFIYEYVGEVINEESFRKRMVEYDEKKFPHFYFMMLKKDSFIDATIKGSLARFCNHSCSPNAYVDKWVVGDKLRMGIFAKRTIQAGEEITFDYNVDRYGAQSQPCYCGEPNCIKVMGGKTQTDAALLLPEGISEALGVTHQMERQWLKENKHLRSKQQKDDAIINEAFVKSIEVTPIEDSEVSKVMGALMKEQDVNITRKLVERIYLTEEPSIHSSIVRMHGYKTLSQVLQTCDNDTSTIVQTLTILSKWPKVTRNKISSSQIEDVVRQLHQQSKNKKISQLSSDLLSEWGNLQMAYRIPKNVNGERSSNSPSVYGRGARSKSPEPAEPAPEEPLPEGWAMTIDPNTQKPYYYHMQLGISRWDRPVLEPPKTPLFPKGPKNEPSRKRPGNFAEDILARQEEERLKQERENQFKEIQQKERMLQDVILQSQRQAEEKRQAEERARLEKLAKNREKHQKHQKHKKHKTEHNLTIEQQWAKLFAKHIPNMIKKHEKTIGHDNVKGCAKDLVGILASKEIKKHPDTAPPTELDRAKLKKIKDFSSMFMDKFLQKYEAKRGEKRKHQDGEESAKKHLSLGTSNSA